MDTTKAKPQGYMTVGEVAKKMHTTVRTLQYYDREGILPPSAVSEGGRRLYSDKDIIKLHQVQSMKYLGFSLDDIKNRLSSLDSPADVAAALEGQAEAIRERMAALSESLKAVEALKAEVLQMQSVDFKKYADIVVNLQMGNELYWLIKYFDDKTLEQIRNRFDKDSGAAVLETFRRLSDEAIRLHDEGRPPDSEEGLALAASWWDMVMEFTDGDMGLLPDLVKFAENMGGMGDGWKEQQSVVFDFLSPALAAYFAKLGYDPFQGAAP